jgi:hypothetical protein
MKRENQTRQPAQVFKKETNTKKETKDLKRDNERVAANERRGERETEERIWEERGERESLWKMF